MLTLLTNIVTWMRIPSLAFDSVYVREPFFLLCILRAKCKCKRELNDCAYHHHLTAAENATFQMLLDLV